MLRVSYLLTYPFKKEYLVQDRSSFNTIEKTGATTRDCPYKPFVGATLVVAPF